MPANSKQQVLNLLNTANNSNFNDTQLVFGAPTPYSGPLNRNTSLIVSASPTAPVVGQVTMYYNRMDLGVLFNVVNMNYVYDADYVNTVDLLPLVNARYNLALGPEDIIDEPLVITSVFPKPQTVRARADSLAYTGEFSLSLVRPPAVDVVTAPELDNQVLGWELEAPLQDGAFITSFDDTPSRGTTLIVGGRARLANENVAPTPTTLVGGEDLYSFEINGSTDDWCADFGVRITDPADGLRLDELYDVVLKVFHNVGPSPGAIYYYLEYVNGAYQLRDRSNNHVYAGVSTDVNRVAFAISAKSLTANAGWAANFTDVPVTAFGAPYVDQDPYPGYIGFDLSAMAKEDPDGHIYDDVDVRASFMVDVTQAFVSNPWLSPIAGPVINTFEDPFVLNGDWYLSTNWSSPAGGHSMQAGTISHTGQTSMTANLIDGTGLQLRFDYKVSSEAGYDYLTLFIDGVNSWEVSGDVAGTYTSAELTPGPHSFEWRYWKDNSVSELMDTAFVDNIEFLMPGPPAVVLPMKRGILASNPGGSMASIAPTTNLALTHASRPMLSNSYFAAMEANDYTEIVAIDGLSNGLTIHYSWDGCLSWITQTINTHKLSSGQMAWFRGKLYFQAEQISDATQGIYRLDRTGDAAGATFTITKVLSVNSIKSAFASNVNYLAVYEDDGAKLHHTIDGTMWSTVAGMQHPSAAPYTLNTVAMAFVGDTLVGVGRHNGLTPPIAGFSCIPGGTVSWTVVDPWGDSRNWYFVEARMKNIDGKLILAVNGPSGGHTAKIMRSVNVGASWTILNDDTGIYPMSIADDGVNVLITGYREDNVAHYRSVAYSTDRAATPFQIGLDSESFYTSAEYDYTFATGWPFKMRHVWTRGYGITQKVEVTAIYPGTSSPIGGGAYPMVADRANGRVVYHDGYTIYIHTNGRTTDAVGASTNITYRCYGTPEVDDDTGTVVVPGGTFNSSVVLIKPDNSYIVITGMSNAKVVKALGAGRFAIHSYNSGVLTIYGPSNNYASALHTFNDEWNVEAMTYDAPSGKLYVYRDDAAAGGVVVIDVATGGRSVLAVGGVRGYFAENFSALNALVLHTKVAGVLSVRDKTTGNELRTLDWSTSRSPDTLQTSSPNSLARIGNTLAVLQEWRLSTNINTRVFALHLFNVATGALLHTQTFPVIAGDRLQVVANPIDNVFYVGNPSVSSFDAISASPPYANAIYAAPSTDTRYVAWL